MNPRKILVVDDEPDIVELVSYNLRKEGYNVTPAFDGEEALNKVKKESFDCMILDLMLPGIQGMELCRIIRNDPRTRALPIIMLTAKGEELDRVLGLEMGADDYLPKPFSLRELMARVRAIMRRANDRLDDERIISIGDLTINKDTYTVSKRGSALSLSTTEFRLLLYLAERRGKVFSRDQLLDAVWSNEAFVEPRTVDVHIRRMRAQIEDDPAKPVYLKTRRGIGYFMDPAV